MDAEILNMPSDSARDSRKTKTVFPVSVDELARLYFEDRLTINEIGKRIGRSGRGVTRRLEAAGYRLRTSKEARCAGPELTEKIINLYFDEGLSCIEISRQITGVSEDKVRYIIIGSGRELRNAVAARGLRAWGMTSIERRLTYGGAKRQLTYAKTKESNAEARKSMPKSERAILEMLMRRSVPELVQQKAVGIYNMDFATGAVGIEVVGGRDKPAYFASSAERIYTILKAGFHLVEVMYGGIDPLQEAACDEIIAFIEHTKTLPPSIREYRMIGGSGQLLAVFKINLDDGA